MRKSQYYKHVSDGATIYPIAAETVYADDSATPREIATTYQYEWHPYNRMKERRTYLPAIPANQNGAATSAVRREWFDQYGNLIWVMDEHGIITRHFYDALVGAVWQTVEDVSPLVTGFELPTGWQATPGIHLHVVTDYSLDPQGRVTQTLGPVHISTIGSNTRRATWIVYDDVNRQVRTAEGYVRHGVATMINPVSIQKFDPDGRLMEMIAATRGSGVESAGALLPSDTFAQSSYVRWTKHEYNRRGELITTKAYHTIPISGEGTPTANYDVTAFGYDADGRQVRVVAPGGTITRSKFDELGRLTETWLGTDDEPTTGPDLTWRGWPAHTTGTNMQKVETRTYHARTTFDGRLETLRRHVDGVSMNDRITAFLYDSRGRTERVTTLGAGTTPSLYSVTTYDHLDRATTVQQYRSDPVITSLVAESRTEYDDAGRVFRSKVYSVTGGVAGPNRWSQIPGTTRQGGSSSTSRRVLKRLPRLSTIISLA